MFLKQNVKKDALDLKMNTLSLYISWAKKMDVQKSTPFQVKSPEEFRLNIKFFWVCELKIKEIEVLY